MSDLINSRRGPESSMSAGVGINSGDNSNQTTSEQHGKKDTDGSMAQKEFEAILAHFLSSNANNNSNRAQAPVSKFSSRPESKFALNEENKGDGDLSSEKDVLVSGSGNQSQSLYESFLSEVFDNQGAQSTEKRVGSSESDELQDVSGRATESGVERSFKQLQLMLRSFIEIYQFFTGKQSIEELNRDAEKIIRESDLLQNGARTRQDPQPQVEQPQVEYWGEPPTETVDQDIAPGIEQREKLSNETEIWGTKPAETVD